MTKGRMHELVDMTIKCNSAVSYDHDKGVEFTIEGNGEVLVVYDRKQEVGTTFYVTNPALGSYRHKDIERIYDPNLTLGGRRVRQMIEEATA